MSESVISRSRFTRRRFLRIAWLSPLVVAGGRMAARSDGSPIATLEASRVDAARWLKRQEGKVCARDFELLRRAQEVFYRNILTAGEAGEALPWAPLRGVCPSLSKYRGVWNWDASFHALAIARWDGELAREQLRIILDRQLPSGALINNIRANGLVRDRYGQPPVMP